MKLLSKEGFSYKFDPNECSRCDGNCCIGESGYIWIVPSEMVKLASFLNIEVEELKNIYLRKIGYKYSIKEKHIDEKNFACVFFDLDKKQCLVYEARPKQCISFPFWDYFKNRVNEVVKECPAIKV